MAGDINSAELCLKAVNVLQEELRNARKTLINSETCVVNRSTMTAQLEYLRDNIPDTVDKAAEIVRNEEQIRMEAERIRKDTLNNAQTQAQGMVDEASAKAASMIDQAVQEANARVEHAVNEANATVENAKAEAARIIADAQKKADELVEEESIVRRARVESEELRESARQEAANLHKNTLNYIDSLLAETDRKMSELINNIRLERNEIQNRR
jgi:cell division septum initiation protein DivIVA